jgi:hypothetical protein
VQDCSWTAKEPNRSSATRREREYWLVKTGQHPSARWRASSRPLCAVVADGPARVPRRCAERAIAIGLGERFELHRFQCDLLRQHDVPDGQIALWTEAPLVGHIVLGIEFLNIHGPTVPDAVGPAGVGPDDVEMPVGIP